MAANLDKSYYCQFVGRFVLTCALLLCVLCPFQTEANLKYSIKPEKQYELDVIGDLALAKINSTMNHLDVERIVRLREATSSLSPPAHWQAIQFVIPQDVFLGGLARAMRFELKAFYLGQKEIDQELFEQTLNEAFVSPCKQLDSTLKGWWLEASQGAYAKADQERYNALITETICRNLLKMAPEKEFVRWLRKVFDNSLEDNVDQLLRQVEPRVSDRVDAILDLLETSQLDQLLFLRRCIVIKASGYGDLFERIPDELMAQGIAIFMLIDNEQAPAELKEASILEQRIKEKYVEPCKVIYATDEMDFEWQQIESICKSLNAIEVADGGFSKLAAQVSQQIPIQLEADQEHLRLRALSIYA